MKTLPIIPPSLQGRHPDAVPIQCDCGQKLLWERKRGDTVRCPDCKRVEELPHNTIRDWKKGA